MRARVLLAVLGLAAAMSGCGGGIKSPDLFIVHRSGSTPQAQLTLLVNEEGGVSCNGGPELQLGDSQIIKARAIQEELQGPISHHLSLPALPGSVLSYAVRDQEGTVTFADNSKDQPKVLRSLVLFVLETAQTLCHLPE